MTISTAVDLSAVARVLGISTKFKDLRGGSILYLPQRIAVVGQGNTASIYSTNKQQVTSAAQAGNLYGFGSPIHLAVTQLLPNNGDGVGTIPVTIYPLADDPSAVAAVGSITPQSSATGSASFVVKINNIRSAQFTVKAGDTVADITSAITTAISSNINIPMIASDVSTAVDLTSKWKGASANDLNIEVESTSEDNSGLTFVIVQPTGGLVNPDIDDALNQFGNVWETFVLNCLNVDDIVSLDKYNTFGEGRWGAFVKKPLVVFTGNTEQSVTLATTISDTRKTDRINSQLVSPGSKDLPLLVAARQLARIAVVANNNPAKDYALQKATGLTAGLDGVQWLYTQRDEAVKKGSSTVEVIDNVVNVSDIVTFYHPAGETPPAYRYVVDIVKLQNIIFNIDMIFADSTWAGSPLIPDNQPTTNPEAKKPKMAVAAVNSVLDSIGSEALISDVEEAQANTVAAIDPANPKRLDVSTVVQLSGNTNIISVDLNFGFYFG